MSDLAQVIHKAVTDREFRAELIADPTSTLTHHCLAVSDEEMAALSDIIRLLGCPSQDLLTKLLATAIGPEQFWQYESRSRCNSVSEP